MTTLAAACAGQSSMAPTVTAVAWATTAIPSAMVSGWLWWSSGLGGGHRRCPGHDPKSSAACACDPRGSVDQLCGAGGLCRCRPGYAGATCQECSPGFHGFPDCARECPGGGRGWGREGRTHALHVLTPPPPPPLACHCSPEGSLHAACDPHSGQCSCRPRVTGLRCDMCVPGAYNFPYCEGGAGPVCVCVCVSGRGGCAACSHDCCSALRALGSHMRSRECPCVVHVVTCCPSIHACLCALCECVLIACSQLCGGGEHMPSQLGGLGQEGTRGFWPVHTCERHVCWLPQGLRSWPGLGKLSAVRVDG